MKHKLVNPFPMEVSDRLIDLLDHWFEWRHKKESPRSVAPARGDLSLAEWRKVN